MPCANGKTYSQASSRAAVVSAAGIRRPINTRKNPMLSLRLFVISTNLRSSDCLRGIVGLRSWDSPWSEPNEDETKSPHHHHQVETRLLKMNTTTVKLNLNDSIPSMPLVQSHIWDLMPSLHPLMFSDQGRQVKGNQGSTISMFSKTLFSSAALNFNSWARNTQGSQNDLRIHFPFLRKPKETPRHFLIVSWAYNSNWLFSKKMDAYRLWCNISRDY